MFNTLNLIYSLNIFTLYIQLIDISFVSIQYNKIYNIKTFSLAEMKQGSYFKKIKGYV